MSLVGFLSVAIASSVAWERMRCLKSSRAVGMVVLALLGLETSTQSQFGRVRSYSLLV